MGYVGNAVLCHKVNIDETCIPSPWNRSPVPVTSGLVFSLSCRDRFLPVPIPRFERYSNTGSFPMSCYWSLNDWPLVHFPPSLSRKSSLRLRQKGTIFYSTGIYIFTFDSPENVAASRWRWLYAEWMMKTASSKTQGRSFSFSEVKMRSMTRYFLHSVPMIAASLWHKAVTQQ